MPSDKLTALNSKAVDSKSQGLLRKALATAGQARTATKIPIQFLPLPTIVHCSPDSIQRRVLAIGCPLGELDLRYELRLEPHAVFHFLPS